MKKNLLKSGFSLVEIVVAIGIFILIAPVVIVTVLGGHGGSLRSENRLQATAYGQEAIEAVRSIRDYDFDDLLPGTYGLTDVNGYYQLSGSSNTDSKYTRTITINQINNYTKEILVNVSWNTTSSVQNSINMTSRLTNWKALYYIQTSLTDFDAGKKNSVASTNTNGGEIQLASVGDLSMPSVFTTKDVGGTANVNGLFAEGNNLYMVTGGNPSDEEFIVYDISDVSNGNITEIGSTDILANVFKVYVSGGYAYLATDRNFEEIMVIDLSNFTKVASINLSGSDDAKSVFVLNNILYIGTDADATAPEFFAYDITNPLLPALLGSAEIGSDVRGISINGGYAYLALTNDLAEMAVIRLSDYSNVNNVDLVGIADSTSIQTSGTTAYVGRVGSVDNEFFALNISSPENPISTINSVDLGTFNANDFYISDNFAYVVTNELSTQEFKIIDLSNFLIKSNLDLTGTSDARAVFFHGQYAYVGSSNDISTLQVVKGGNGGWQIPTLIDSYNTDENLNALAVYVDNNNFVYVGTQNNTGVGDNEFYILNAAVPSNVTLVGGFDVGFDVNALYVSGTTAYLATSNDAKELLILDVTNPVNPVEIGSYDSDSTFDGVAVTVNSNKIYFGTLNNTAANEFYVLDQTNLNLLDSLNAGDSVNAITISGNYAYLGTSNNLKELMAVDVTDPLAIFESAVFNANTTADSNDLEFDNNTVYLVTDNGSTFHDFYILDATNPVDPWPVSLLSVTRQVVSSGNYAYVAVDSPTNGFSVVDPNNPTKFYNVNVLERGRDVFVSGNKAYVATNSVAGGLAIVDVTNPTSPGAPTLVNVQEKGNAVYSLGTKVYVATENQTKGLAIVDTASGNSVTSVNVTRRGQDVIADATNAYVAVNNPAVGLAIVNLTTNVVTPVNVGGSSLKVFVHNGYVYNAVNNVAGGLTITQIANPSNIYTVNVTGNARDVYVANNKAYVATDNVAGGLVVVDVTNPAASVVTNTINVGGRVKSVKGSGNYIYLAVENLNRGMVAVDINNLAGIFNFNVSGQGQDIFVSGNKAFVCTNNATFGFAIVDVTTPATPKGIKLLSSLDLATNNNGVAFDSTNKLLHIANDTLLQQLKIYDVSNLIAPVLYSIFNLNNRATGVHFSNGNSYLSSWHDNLEVQIVGPLPTVFDYSLLGIFTSQIFDAGSNVNFSNFSWTQSGIGNLKFQLRTADISANLTNAKWVGFDGTSSTYYTVSNTTVVTDPAAAGTQFIQWRAFLDSDSLTTPILEDVTISYQ